MAEQTGRQIGLSSLVPLFIGGAIAGGMAMMFAPQLLRARDAVCAAGQKTKELMKQRRHPKPVEAPEESIYCAVPDLVDICHEEKSGS